MKNYGRASVHEFLGDLIVYRNLIPQDKRLPSVEEIRPLVGLPPDVIPRKSDPMYAHVIVQILQEARAVDAPGTSIERLVYLGDTQLNDGTAFGNICHAGDWEGIAFIAAERDDPERVEIVEQGENLLYLANRWSALTNLNRFFQQRGFPPDERTAVIVDLDKTALGARGRNDHVIDRARVGAVRRTVGDLLGDEFDPVGFQEVYDHLNRPEFHHFTTDNQDYLAYICLILGSGWWTLEETVSAIQSGQTATFADFIAEVDGSANELPAILREIHQSVYACVCDGDPTPFKAFRFNEYRTTVECMGRLQDDAPVEELLEEEIVITREVQEMAMSWRDQGALLFGLSDKPDEASVPPADLANQGFQAIHRTITHAVGG